jgi:hypothetical protein
MPVATNDLLETFYQEGMINCAEAKKKESLMNEHSAGTIIILPPAYLPVFSSSLSVLLTDC